MGQPVVVFEVGEQLWMAPSKQPGPRALQRNLDGIAHVAGNPRTRGTECCLMRSWEYMQATGAEGNLFGAMTLLGKQETNTLARGAVHGVDTGGAPHRNIAARSISEDLCCQIPNVAKWEVHIAEENRADRIWVGYMGWKVVTACQQALLLLLLLLLAVVAFVLKEVVGNHVVEAVQNGSRAVG